MGKYETISERRAEREAREICAVLRIQTKDSRELERSARSMATTLAFLLRAHVVRERERIARA